MSRKPPSNVKPFQGDHTFLQMQLMANTVTEILSRQGMAGKLGKAFGDKRDLYNVLGYNRNPGIEDYWGVYLRQDIAKRIVKAAPNATWRRPPDIWETDSPDETTPFEAAWEELVRQLRVWSYFARADRLAGVGYYGVMLIGVKGALDTPVPVMTKKFKSIKDVLYLSTFSQRHATVKEFETDPTKARFGKPKSYEVDLDGDLAGQDARRKPTNKNVKKATNTLQTVDATRVLHFAEDLSEDEVHGTPRLEAVFNRLMDLEKVVGGSAEGYWRGAWGGFSLESDGQITGGVDQEALGDIADEFSHGFRRWLALEGYKMNKIEGQDFKPKEVFDTIIALMSAATDIPQRILCGSERGQLASTQDEAQWNKFLEDRRNNYAEPLIREFIDRLISWGVLPEPAQYSIHWPDLYSLDALENSQVVQKISEAIKNVAPGGQVELVMTPDEFRTTYLGLEPLGTDTDLEPLGGEDGDADTMGVTIDVKTTA